MPSADAHPAISLEILDAIMEKVEMLPDCLSYCTVNS